jgi:hypothetical protein
MKRRNFFKSIAIAPLAFNPHIKESFNCVRKKEKSWTELHNCKHDVYYTGVKQNRGIYIMHEAICKKCGMKILYPKMTKFASYKN